jgi:hypothetical protein
MISSEEFIEVIKAFRHKEAVEQRRAKERQEVAQLKQLIGEEE